MALSTVALAGQPTKRLSDEQRGKELWERHCVACHGVSNRGDGPTTLALVQPVPDLRGKVKADDPTIKIVSRGLNAMPGYETTFDRQDARRVLQYMAKLKTGPLAPKPATAPPPATIEEPSDGQAPEE